MAILALTNAKLVIASVDFSSYLTDVTLDINAADLNATAMSSAGWEAHLAGLKSFKFDATLNQDFAASAVDATLWAAFGTVVAVTANPVNAANSATNPQYQFNVVVGQYSPISGKVGDLLQTKISWVGTGAITRAVV